MQNARICLTLFLLLLIPYISRVHLSQCFYIDSLLLIQIYCLFMFPRFLPTVLFFLFQNPIQGPYYIESSQLLKSLQIVTMSQTFLLWIAKQFWDLIRNFIECTSIAICLMFFSWSDCHYGSWGGELQRYNAILITSYQVYMLSIWLITVNVDLGHLTEVVFVTFLHWKITLPGPLYISYSLEEMCSLNLKGESYTLPPWGEKLTKIT